MVKKATMIFIPEEWGRPQQRRLRRRPRVGFEMSVGPESGNTERT